MSLQQDNLAVLVAWLDAMRRGDLDAVTELFAPDVVWRGVPADAICHNRAEVLDMLELQIGEGFVSIHALELIPGDDSVVLGVRSPELQEIGDQPLPGQLLNVFTIRDGRISSVHDYAKRSDALRAAGANEPRWV
jgi:ketosteroid isomerase-like protein